MAAHSRSPSTPVTPPHLLTPFVPCMVAWPSLQAMNNNVNRHERQSCKRFVPWRRLWIIIFFSLEASQEEREGMK